MNVDFKKEQINLSEMKMNEVSNILVEGDVIVPDVKPDIKEILIAEANAVMNKQDYTMGKLMVSGSVFLKVLYAPENADEDSPKVRSINTKFDFNDEIDCPNVENLHISAKCNTERLEFSLVNSRKMNIKINVGTQVKGYVQKNIEVAYDVAENQPLEIKKDNISLYNILADLQKELIVADSLDVPSTKPDIEEVLKLDVKATKGDCKVMANKILVKGFLSVSTLYTGLENSRSVEHMEHEIPFSEVVDVDGLSEECLCNVTYDIKDVYYTVKDDINGDPRVLSVEVLVCANVVASQTFDMDMIRDCYSPLGDANIMKQKVSLDELINEGTSQSNLKELIAVQPEMPTIDAVYNVTCKPIIMNKHMQDNQLVLTGNVVAFVLYVSSNDENPMYSFVEEIPFEHSIPIDDINENMMCEADVSLLNVSFSLNAASEIELRCTLEFYTKILKEYELELISECAIDEAEITENNNAPSLVIYFVQENDTMWDIAKHYRTTAKKILAANQMEDENNLHAVSKLLIPKV